MSQKSHSKKEGFAGANFEWLMKYFRKEKQILVFCMVDRGKSGTTDWKLVRMIKSVLFLSTAHFLYRVVY